MQLFWFQNVTTKTAEPVQIPGQERNTPQPANKPKQAVLRNLRPDDMLYILRTAWGALPHRPAWDLLMQTGSHNLTTSNTNAVNLRVRRVSLPPVSLLVLVLVVIIGLVEASGAVRS